MAIVINSKDNVAVALRDIKGDSYVRLSNGKKIYVKQSIPFGHKFAVKKIDKGEPIIKYGETIGVATSAIEEGKHVHVHNIVSPRSDTGDN